MKYLFQNSLITREEQKETKSCIKLTRARRQFNLKIIKPNVKRISKQPFPDWQSTGIKQFE
jgi:hypothetical protein